jgi:hypothetical protein
MAEQYRYIAYRYVACARVAYSSWSSVMLLLIIVMCIGFIATSTVKQRVTAMSVDYSISPSLCYLFLSNHSDIIICDTIITIICTSCYYCGSIIAVIDLFGVVMIMFMCCAWLSMSLACCNNSGRENAFHLVKVGGCQRNIRVIQRLLIEWRWYVIIRWSVGTINRVWEIIWT